MLCIALVPKLQLLKAFLELACQLGNSIHCHQQGYTAKKSTPIEICFVDNNKQATRTKKIFLYTGNFPNLS